MVATSCSALTVEGKRCGSTQREERYERGYRFLVCKDCGAILATVERPEDERARRILEKLERMIRDAA